MRENRPTPAKDKSSALVSTSTVRKVEFQIRSRLNRRVPATMAGNVVPAVDAVDAFGELLKELFQRAEEVKQTNTVEPPLSKPDLEDILERVEATFFSSAKTLELRKQRHAAIDTAIRDKFNELLVSSYWRNLASLF